MFQVCQLQRALVNVTLHPQADQIPQLYHQDHTNHQYSRRQVTPHLKILGNPIQMKIDLLHQFDDNASLVGAAPLLKLFVTQVQSKFGENTSIWGSMLSDGQLHAETSGRVQSSVGIAYDVFDTMPTTISTGGLTAAQVCNVFS